MQRALIDKELLATLGGRVRRVRGHHPMVLDNTRVMWLVAEGSAAVFTSRVANGLPVGKRRLLLRAGPGTPLFSVSDELSESSSRLIVLSIEPLTLYEVPLMRVDQLLAAVGIPLASAIESWVTALCEFAAQRLDAQVAPETLHPSGTVELTAGQAIRAPRETLLWVQVEDGELHLFGERELRLGKIPVYFPMAANAWMTTPDTAQVLVRTTAEIQDNRARVRGLALFNSLFQQRVAQIESRDLRAERRRLSERGTQQQRMVTDSMGRLAATLNPQAGAPQPHTPLLGALNAIGAALGLEIRAPAAGAPAQGSGAEGDLLAVLRASRLRHRSVLLAGEWWRKDCGPLLAYLEEDHRPVALLRDELRGYAIVDPVQGTRTALDADTTLLLEPRAVTLYRRLPDRLSSVWRLVAFSRGGGRGDLALILTMALVVTLLGMITPQATALIMDSAIPDADRRLLLELGLGLLAAALGASLFGLAQSIASIRFSIHSDATTQSAMWDRLLNLRMAFFKKFATGDLLARAMAVSEVTQELNGQALTSLLASAMALLNLALLYYYSATLATIALGLGLVVAAVSLGAGIYIRRYYRELMELEGHFFGLVVQLVNAVGKIRVAGAQGRAFSQWANRYAEQLDLVMKAARLEDYVSVFNQMIPLLSTIALFWVGVSLLGGGEALTDAQAGGALTVGVFLAFNTAMGTFLSGATSLSHSVLETLDTLAKARRMNPLLEADPEVDASKADPGLLHGAVTLANVDFRYADEGADVLHALSFRVQAGEFVAFTGPSGSGKSTIMRLLLGFEVPRAGAVLFDGRDLAGLDVAAVRRQLGVVLQSGRINAGSIHDNVTAGAQLSLDDVWLAIDDAGLGQDVRDMPMGLHTVISEGGTNLSGGQRQRLFIARALARKPRILLFDEATSALDNRTQAVVSESLERRKVTRLVIAHRLSTIRDADRIYVLRAGQIVETGRFEELVAAKGLFASMIARQVA